MGGRAKNLAHQSLFLQLSFPEAAAESLSWGVSYIWFPPVTFPGWVSFLFFFFFLIFVGCYIWLYASHLTFSHGATQTSWQTVTVRLDRCWWRAQPSSGTSDRPQGVSLVQGRSGASFCLLGSRMPGPLDEGGGWCSRRRSAYRGLCHTKKPGLYLSVYPVDFSRFLGHDDPYHFSCSVGISFFIPRRRAY